MKLLLLGLFPVIIFWFVEEKFGTFWGLVAAMVWAICECAYEWIRFRKINKFTLMSSGLVIVLGGLGLWLDNSVLFKFQPVIVETLFAGILIFTSLPGKEPLFFKMAQQTKPEAFQHGNPEIIEKQKQIMSTMTWHLVVVLIIHSGLLTYYALHGTTGQWAFWKGVGFNIFIVVWFGLEFVAMKIKFKKNN